MKSMLTVGALIMAAGPALAGAPARRGAAPEIGRRPLACQRVTCTDQCWEVKITYRQVVSAPGETPVYQTAMTTSGGAWGDVEGARCYADQVSREGFWLNEDGLTPTPGPQKIPASAVDFLLVGERPF